MNTQKGLAPVAIILVVVGILLIGSGAYYLVKNYKPKPVENPVASENIQKTNQPAQPISPTQPKEQPTTTSVQQPSSVIQWENLMPDIRAILEKELNDGQPLEKEYPFITKEIDVTGDGKKEALVAFAQGGAASGPLQVLMRVKNGKPSIVLFRRANGEISPLTFLEAASASYGTKIGLLPDEKIVFVGGFDTEKYVKKLSNWCHVDVYQWNDNTEIFEFSSDENLNKKIKSNYCDAVQKDLEKLGL
jgi:hypothetical protein